MRQQLASGRSTGFLRGAGITVVAGIAASLLQMGFHFVAARWLSPRSYADVNALLSLVFMVGLPASVIQTAVATRLAKLSAQNRLGECGDLFRRTVRGLLWPALAAGGVLAACTGRLATALRVEQHAAVTVTAAVIALLLLLPAWRGAVQGLRRFDAFGLSQIGEGVVRLVALAAVLAAGAGVVGAMGTSLIALGAALVLLTPPLRPILQAPPTEASAEYVELRRHLLPVAAALTCFAVLSNIDVALVKSLYPHDLAGDYAAAAVIGRAVLYISLAVTTVMLPVVAHESAREQRVRPVLLQSLLLSGAMCGTCAAVLAAWPGALARVALGPQYAHVGPLVRWYAVAMVAMVPLNTLLNYQLGRGRSRFLWVLVPYAIAHTAVLSLARTSLFTVLGIVTASGVLSSTLLAAHMLCEHQAARKAVTA